MEEQQGTRPNVVTVDLYNESSTSSIRLSNVRKDGAYQNGSVSISLGDEEIIVDVHGLYRAASHLFQESNLGGW